MNELIYYTHAEEVTNNSGGPSTASSDFISCPILLISQTLILLSADEEAKTLELFGSHSTFITSSVWPSKIWRLLEVFLRSQNPIVLSFEPVIKRYSSKELKSIELISAAWPKMSVAGPPGFLKSHLSDKFSYFDITIRFFYHLQLMQKHQDWKSASKHPMAYWNKL